MNDAAGDDLRARVERLERENRRWRRGVAAVILLVGAALLMGQAGAPAVPEEFRTRALAIVDEQGTRRAVLSARKDGVFLSIADEAGTSRAVLGSSGSGSSLTFLDEKGKMRARLGSLDHVPALELHSPDGDVQASLAAHLAGSELRLLDPTGAVTARLQSIGGFGPELRLGDASSFGVLIKGRIDGSQIWLRDASAGADVMLDAGKHGPSVRLRDA